MFSRQQPAEFHRQRTLQTNKLKAQQAISSRNAFIPLPSALAFFLRYPWTIVFDANSPDAPSELARQANFSSGRRLLQGVRRDIEQDLPQATLVKCHQPSTTDIRAEAMTGVLCEHRRVGGECL